MHSFYNSRRDAQALNVGVQGVEWAVAPGAGRGMDAGNGAGVAIQIPACSYRFNTASRTWSYAASSTPQSLGHVGLVSNKCGWTHHSNGWESLQNLLQVCTLRYCHQPCCWGYERGYSAPRRQQLLLELLLCSPHLRSRGEACLRVRPTHRTILRVHVWAQRQQPELASCQRAPMP